MNDVQLDSNNDNHSDSDSNNDVEDNGDEDEDEDDRDEDRDGDGSDEGDDNEDDGEGDAVVHISVGKDGRKRTRKKIRLAWCEKSDGSPGRRKSGYPLRETLKMTNGGYRIVYGGVKVLLMRTKGIDMTRTITKQPKELINHVVRKALSLYPEFEMFCRGALWPLKAFAHVILRTSSDQYRKRLSDGSGTKATKAKKVAKTSNTKKKKPIEDMEVENHPAVEDSSLGEVERSLAVEPPVEEELPFDEPPFEGGPASDGVNNAEPPEADDVDDMDMVAHNLSRATLDETMNSVQGK
ncbi:hypothetical protein FRC10_007894 [Ceratobasidium sp. 414]|nr:hypothetical protein FRC10_007894 [Ceratobasidium sp. 414]